MPKLLGPRDPDGHRYRRGHGTKRSFAPLSAARKGKDRAYFERDHRSLRLKIAIRRWLLTRMQFDDVTVLDACSGEGYIWTEMEKFVTIRRWVRSDIKPRATNGRNHLVLKMSAAQAVESMDLDCFNVIDIDTYGEPWDAYRIILERFSQPTAVFLTHGRTAYDVTDETRDAMGIPRSWPIPQRPETVDFIVKRTLEATRDKAEIQAAGRVFIHPGISRAPVTYYGIGLCPKT